MPDSQSTTSQWRLPGTPARRARVAVLMLALSAASLWASWTSARRDLRTAWKRPLDIAVVLLPQGDIPDADLDLLRSGIPRLERLLATEFARYRPERTLVPVVFTVSEPHRVERAPPVAPDGGGAWERARHAWELRRYFAPIHEALGLETSRFDARIYLVLREPRGERMRFVEGIGAKNGDVAIVRSDLERESLDLTLLALGHELLHFLGATDKYDPDGRAVAPRGLAEPDRKPLYPQQYAEIMVGEIPLSPRSGRVPDTLSQVRIGPVTAAEIGWIRKDAPAPAEPTAARQ